MNLDVSLFLPWLVFGFSAGLSPGPFQTLLISQTLKHGVREGVLVAFAPLITDVPIFFIAVSLLSQFSHIDPIMGGLSFIGAAFLVYLAYGNFRICGIEDAQSDESPESIKKGVMTNFLNPHPYMFWLLVGAPTLMKAYRSVGMTGAGLSIVGFYVCLIATFIGIVGLVGTSRSFLKGRGYLYAVRALGVALLVFALRFVWEGLEFFGFF